MKQKVGFVLAFAVVLGVVCSGWFLLRSRFSRQVEPPEGLHLWEKRVYSGSAGKVLAYRLLLPANCNPKIKYPLVLFLHGAGDRGDDNEKHLFQGVHEFAKEEIRKQYPCFVVAPQCPPQFKWADEDLPPTPEPTEPTRLVLEMVPALIEELNIDAQRVYITGISMGGSGTWDVLARRPDLFAAAVPICGGGDKTQVARFAHIPIWAFHGTRDTVVQPEHSRTMIEALKAAGGDPKYTEYPEVGHWSWLAAYQDPELFQWLFVQKRN